MSAALEIVLVSALPVVPAYIFGVYAIRFLLTPRSPRRHALFALYCAVLLGIKPVIDFYWQYTNEGRSLAILHGAVLTLTLPVVLWYCFGGDWRRRLFVLFPYVCIQSVFIMPPIILLLQTGLPLRPVWQVMFLAASALACGLAVLVTDRLARLVEKLPGPVYTALAAASPAVNLLFNLDQARQSLQGDSRLETAAILSWRVAELGLLLAAVFFWLLRRQAKQTVAIAAAREAMHQRAVATQQRSLTELRTLHAAHRENLEALDALLAEGRTQAALDKVRALTRQESQAARRYADNPVADASLAEAARRCGEAGVALNIRGTLPRDCTLPPVDLASLLYNLLSKRRDGGGRGAPAGNGGCAVRHGGGAALRHGGKHHGPPAGAAAGPGPWLRAEDFAGDRRPLRRQLYTGIRAGHGGGHRHGLPARQGGNPWVTGGRARPWIRCSS